MCTVHEDPWCLRLGAVAAQAAAAAFELTAADKNAARAATQAAREKARIAGGGDGMDWRTSQVTCLQVKRDSMNACNVFCF